MQNPALINKQKYPIASSGGNLLWNIDGVEIVPPEIWTEWVEMGHTRHKHPGGYLYSPGFDPTSGELRFAPYYHALNINQLTTGHGYFFEGVGPAISGATFESASGASKDTASSLTFAHTVATNDYRLLLIDISTSGPSTTIQTVTYGGRACIKLASNSSGSSFNSSLWYLVDPPTGANNVVVTCDVGRHIVANARDFSDVDPSTPFGTVVPNAGTGTAVTATVSTTTGEIVADIVTVGTVSITSTEGANQTEDWDDTQVGISSAGTHQAGADGGVMSSTLSGAGGTWTTLAVPIKPVANQQFVYCADGDKIFKMTYDSQMGLTEVVALSSTAEAPFTSATITDTVPNFSDDEWNDYLIEIIAGTGAGQRRRITDTTAGTDLLDIGPDAWDVTPDATSEYVIYASVYVASGVAGRPVHANGKTYVPMGAGANARRLDSIGTTIDTWADAGWVALHLANYQQGVQVAVARAYSTNLVDLNYDTGNLSSWAGDNFPIGDASTAITDLHEMNGELMVSKEDTFYQMTQEGTSKPLGTFRNRAATDPENGKGTKVWADRVLYPSLQGLDRYLIGDKVRGVGINQIKGFREIPQLPVGTTPLARRHAWVEAVGHNAYIGMNYGEKTALIHGRLRESGDPVGMEMVYNQFHDIPLTKNGFIDSRQRLWLKGATADESSRDIRVIELDDHGGLQKPLRRGLANFVASIILPETDWGAPFSEKQARHLTVELSQWDSNASLRLYVWRDDGTHEAVGDAMTADGVYEQTWTVGTDDRLYRGRLWLRVELNSNYTPLDNDPRIKVVGAHIRSPAIIKAVVQTDGDAPIGKTAKDVYEELSRMQDQGEIIVVEPDQMAAGIDPDDPDVSGAISFNAEIFSVKDTRYAGDDDKVGYGVEVGMRRWVIA